MEEEGSRQSQHLPGWRGRDSRRIIGFRVHGDVFILSGWRSLISYIGSGDDVGMVVVVVVVVNIS